HSYYGFYGNTIAGVNVDHNRISNPGMITAGTFVAAYFVGKGANGIEFYFNDVNSTGSLTNAYLVQLITSTVTIKNNIFFANLTVTGSSASLKADAGSGFTSDFNDW